MLSASSAIIREIIYLLNNMEIKQIFANNREWVKSKLQADDMSFEKLSNGQSPEILYIGCSDSQVPAEEFMGMDPGQVFV